LAGSAGEKNENMLVKALAAIAALAMSFPTLAADPYSASVPEMGWTARRTTAPKAPADFPLYPGTAPGSEGAKQQEVWTNMWDQNVVRNVTRPAITPYRPKRGTANGSAVIILPGGGFNVLSMENEGWPIGKWFADRGVTAFVLKYRLVETADVEAEFLPTLAQAVSSNPHEGSVERPGLAFAVADAQATLRLIRDQSAHWGIDKNRIGMIGFSAGAAATLGVVSQDDPTARPDFIAPIYGEMLAMSVPENAPPMFAAMAADDLLYNKQGYGLIESWQQAARPVEFHLYETGGHGFGAGKAGTTSQHWLNDLLAWMTSRGFAKR
jgi:acetyl esterase/lipase